MSAIRKKTDLYRNTQSVWGYKKTIAANKVEISQLVRDALKD